MKTAKRITAIICALLLGYWYTEVLHFASGDFRNNLWAPAYLLLHGESPYHIQVLFSTNTAVWFPQIISLLFPLGLLSQKLASYLWMVLNLLAVFSITFHLTGKANRDGLKPLPTGFILIGVLFFPATLTHLSLGQIDFLLMAVLLAGAFTLEKGKTPATAICFALALTKPQICFLIIPCVFISLIIRRKWTHSLKLSLFTTVFALVMALPLWILYPGWSKDFILNLSGLPKWNQPSLLTQSQALLGGGGIIFWFLLAAACLAAGTYMWTRLPAQRAILWTLALTTIAAPYLWSWDFTLLLPLFIDTAARLTKGATRVVLISTWAAGFILSIWSYRFDTGDNRLWWLPLLMFLGLGICLFLERRGNQNEKGFKQEVP
jgi:hypothetical protein